MRAFLAIPLAENLRSGVAEAQEDLRGAGADVSWIPPASLHLTLKFLGEISADARPDFKPLPPFDLELAGVGEFSGRIVWAGCRGALREVREAAARAEEFGERLGVPRERRPFSPHVTIGRIRSPRNLSHLRDRIRNSPDRIFGPWPVRRIVLFRSELSPRGAVYTVVAEYPCA
jgi:2'-5' RNA ligase